MRPTLLAANISFTHKSINLETKYTKKETIYFSFFINFFFANFMQISFRQYKFIPYKFTFKKNISLNDDSQLMIIVEVSNGIKIL